MTDTTSKTTLHGELVRMAAVLGIKVDKEDDTTIAIMVRNRIIESKYMINQAITLLGGR